MSVYASRPHLGCACTITGQLTFEETVVETVVINKRDVKRFNAPKITKQISKDMFKCDKCDELINIVVCPSWEDFVLRGKIRVPTWLYWKIKKAREKRIGKA